MRASSGNGAKSDFSSFQFVDFPAWGTAGEVTFSNFEMSAIARFELEEGEQGIGYFTTLYLHLFTSPYLRSELESPHIPQPSLFGFKQISKRSSSGAFTRIDYPLHP